jgi:hypothetical protein
MRSSPITLATLVLAACGEMLIVVPAIGDQAGARASSAQEEPSEAHEHSSRSRVGVTAAGAGLGGGGCKSVATFTSSAVPALQKDGCVACHSASNATARAALDLTSVGTNDAAACAQALTKVNLTNKAQSILIQAPAGTHSHLGGKVEDPQAYTAALLGWMNNE